MTVPDDRQHAGDQAPAEPNRWLGNVGLHAGLPHISPDPARLVRPTRHPERFYAYRTSVGTTPAHFHKLAEIMLVRGGCGTVRIGAHQYVVSRDSLVLAMPDTPHHQMTDNSIEKFVCMFDMGLVEPLLSRDQVPGHLRQLGTRYPAAVELTPSDALDAESMFEWLCIEHARTRLGRGTVVAGVLGHLMVQLLRQSTVSVSSATSEPVEEFRDDFERVVAHLHEHFTEPINRRSVARSLGMRPEYVSRAFGRVNGGESFAGYLTNLRLGHAAELLQSTVLSAAEIARLSGFHSYRTFARAFRSRHGLSPSAFRKPTEAA